MVIGHPKTSKNPQNDNVEANPVQSFSGAHLCLVNLLIHLLQPDHWHWYRFDQ